MEQSIPINFLNSLLAIKPLVQFIPQPIIHHQPLQYSSPLLSVSSTQNQSQLNFSQPTTAAITSVPITQSIYIDPILAQMYRKHDTEMRARQQYLDALEAAIDSMKYQLENANKLSKPETNTAALTPLQRLLQPTQPLTHNISVQPYNLFNNDQTFGTFTSDIQLLPKSIQLRQVQSNDEGANQLASQVLCLVCNRIYDGSQHYGVEICRSCAAFFRRCAGSNRQFHCRRGTENCQLNMPNKITCQKCRWKRCQEVGLKVEYVCIKNYRKMDTPNESLSEDGNSNVNDSEMNRRELKKPSSICPSLSVSHISMPENNDSELIQV